VSSSGIERQFVAVTMPDPGAEEAEARIVAWGVSAGDEVEEGDPICVVSVDGHHAEVLSASSGRVAKLMVGVDARVQAGATLAELEPLVAEPEAAVVAPADEPEPVDMDSFHSPAVRRLAAAHGIDLGEIVGTGAHGRIRKEDVLEAQRALETS
jgi:pyruvate/2-oxoglutarate dehydrogenase complex dihydrolipoamide acyltransferase (E2) component